MRRFLKDTKAASALEFGIVFPVLFLVLVGIVEFGFTMFFDSSLNAGIREVARAGITQGYTDMAPINATMSKNLGGLYNPNAANTTFVMRSYNSFANMQTDRIAFQNNGSVTMFNAPPPMPAVDCGAAANPPNNFCQSGQVVMYGVRYKWGGLTGLFPFVPQYLYSFSIVRNENFSE